MQNEFQDGPEEYEFLQEKIKDQDTKEQVRRGLPRIIGTGLLFGVCASIGFFFMSPVLEKNFGNVQEVDLVPDPDENENQADVSEQEKKQEKTDPADVVLNLDHYKELQRVLSKIGRKASKSVVKIQDDSSDDSEDGGKETFYNQNAWTGLIIADNGRELLILGKTPSAKKVRSVHVTFDDNRTYAAGLRKGYELLGYSIYAVDKSELSEKTLKAVSVAELASHDSTGRGDTLICVGSPYGYSDTIVYTTAINVKNQLTRTDGEYKLITTDLQSTENSTGIFFNLDGKVIGIADNSLSEETGRSQLFGFEISGITPIIEKLSNGTTIPYTGINGYTVTKKMQGDGIPEGIYVESVVADSPAMEAGLQTGDIITSVNDLSVIRMNSYQKILMDTKAGDTLSISGIRYGKNGYKEISLQIDLPAK